MQFIHRSKVVALFLILILFEKKAFSQNISLLELKETKAISFGIGIGIGGHALRIEKDMNFAVSDSILSINPQVTPGFFIQLLNNINLSKHFSLRSGPLFHYTNYNIEYTLPQNKTKNFIFDYFKLGIPLDLVFKSDIINNFRFYIFSGIYGAYNFTSNQYIQNILFLRINKYEYGIQGGIGFLFDGSLTITGVELKYQFGINNMLTQDPNDLYSKNISSIKTANILLVINFF